MIKKFKNKAGGFSLIELLVVIAIIGILAAIVIASVSRIRTSARDAKRVAALRTVDTVVGLWLSNKAYIPDAAGRQVTDVAAQTDPNAIAVPCNTTHPIAGLPAPTPCLAMKSNSSTFIGASGTGFATDGILSTKLTDPVDPGCFLLYVTDGVDYETMVQLENDPTRMQNDGGNEPLAYERGSNTSLAGTWASMATQGIAPCTVTAAPPPPPGPPPGPPPPPPPPSGLVASYNFNGNANDQSGNGNNGTLFGAATLVPGQSGFGSALSLDGAVGSYMIAATSTAVNNLSSGTWTGWINESDNADRAIISKSDNNGTVGWWVASRTGGWGMDIVRTLNTRRYSTLTSGSWHYVAITWDGGLVQSSVNIYIDTNTPVASFVNVQDGSGTHDPDTLKPLYIGFSANVSQLNNFKGLLDNIRIYNRALSPAEIQVDHDIQN